MKKITLTLLSLCSASLFANAESSGQQTWHDLSDPRAIYSSAGVAAGKDGVNLSASYGGYLNGSYKHKLTVESVNDLDYYNVDYILVDSNTDAGFTLESSWDRDIWDIKNVNNTAVGVFAKVPLANEQLTLYPKLDLGLLWGKGVKSTTYIQIETPLRYKISDVIWVGTTPAYTYAMRGSDLNEWDASIDAGIQLSPEFAFAGHANTDSEVWVDVTFTF